MDELERIEIENEMKIYPSWENLFWYLEKHLVNYDYNDDLGVISIPYQQTKDKMLDPAIAANIAKFENAFIQVEGFGEYLVVSLLE
jgi:hypothetical protein